MKLQENGKGNLEFCDEKAKVCGSNTSLPKTIQMGKKQTDHKNMHKYMRKKSKPCKNLISHRPTDTQTYIWPAAQ
jgi:hypothetical protein